MTVNTHKGFSSFNRRFVLPELRDAVRAVSADLVFLQEVLGAHEALALRHHDRWPQIPHYEFLADSIWQEHAYGRNAVYPKGHHGNALMSKYPIIDSRNVDASIIGTEKRGVLHCVIRPDEHTRLHAFCVHLGLREHHRKRQLAILGELLKAVPGDEPVIVAGDFNDWRGQARRLLAGYGLTDVYEREYGRPPKTFPARFPLFRLDRIYVRNVQSYRPVPLPNRPWSHLSDHAPLAADVLL